MIICLGQVLLEDLLGFFRHGYHPFFCKAQQGIEDTPPVLPLGLAQLHPQSMIVSGGEGEITVGFLGEGTGGDGGRGGVREACLVNDGLGQMCQFITVVSSKGSSFISAVKSGAMVCHIGDESISHLQFEDLVLRIVAVGDDMKPQYLIGYPGGERSPGYFCDQGGAKQYQTGKRKDDGCAA